MNVINFNGGNIMNEITIEEMLIYATMGIRVIINDGQVTTLIMEE